jgi:phosphatidylinositol alpha-mannosyltransferase
LDPRKGFPVAVRAFERLADEFADLHLVVAGDGPERRAVAHLSSPVRRRVVMVGAVPHAELPPYHAAADVSAAPAIGRESFGLVLVEALAAGLPVVATDVPGYREVITDGIDGLLVPPGDPVALAGAVGRVLREPDLAERLSTAARTRARDFSWDHVAGRIEAAYGDAVARLASL